jgi:hypothetical protein
MRRGGFLEGTLDQRAPLVCDMMLKMGRDPVVVFFVGPHRAVARGTPHPLSLGFERFIDAERAPMASALDLARQDHAQ